MSPRSIVINRGPSLYSMYYIEKSAELGERSCMTEIHSERSSRYIPPYLQDDWWLGSRGDHYLAHGVNNNDCVSCHWKLGAVDLT
jgi:hypothetical protein